MASKSKINGYSFSVAEMQVPVWLWRESSHNVFRWQLPENIGKEADFEHGVRVSRLFVRWPYRWYGRIGSFET